jgi:type ISP restriction-modification system protein/N-6 DNA methylase
MGDRFSACRLKWGRFSTCHKISVPKSTASTKPATPTSLVRRMVDQARQLRQQLEAGSADLLQKTCDLLSETLGREIARSEAADVLAQSITCAAPILAAAPQNVAKALPWLAAQMSPWQQHALEAAQGYWRMGLAHHFSATSEVGPAHPASCKAAHLYEHFLDHYSAARRKRRGVFFTPQPIADYIVRQVDRLLRDNCGLTEGLAANSAPCAPPSALPFILDPACGTGVFLLTAIDHIHRTLLNRWHAERFDAAEIQRHWNAFVPDLLTRLCGIEILPPAAFVARLNIALKLAETGYDFHDATPLNIITGDALSLNLQSAIRNLQWLPVVLGNPPFSSLSTNTNDWIARLVRGDDEIRGYIRANGQQLGERKTWLHDDYVKFIRLAQWHVEEASAGIVGFVTNHGYLDNATFRLMRHELLRVFPHIQIVDLHGNRKKHECPPTLARSASEGSAVSAIRDENVFGLDQGVAIGLFCRPPTQARRASEGKPRSQTEYAELWGSREQKLRSLACATGGQTATDRQCHSSSLALRARVVAPGPPDWRLISAPRVQRHLEYDSGWSLAEAMPINTTAPVTARDHFVVAFTVEELINRIAVFRDLTIPDDEIRCRYFTRTRSARYPSGDTRGWKLAEARRIVAADADWQAKIVRCLYRPFDWRHVFWHPAMIDWPRNDVTRHLLPPAHSPQPPALFCLIARRQQLPTQPCTFFWIADGLALDGVIRSDNRGSESLFPLYAQLESTWQANFANGFIEQFRSAMGLAWQPLGRGDLAQTIGPEDLLAYIYALFHAPSYRERYADTLRGDFPRILTPRDPALFKQMVYLGRELVELHLLRPSSPASASARPDPIVSAQYSALSTQDQARAASISAEPCDSALPGFRSPTSDLRPPTSAPEPRTLNPEPSHSFRAGGYVALHKWLRPKHRSAAEGQYARIAAAIGRTLEIMPTIDAAVASCGGWDQTTGDAQKL